MDVIVHWTKGIDDDFVLEKYPLHDHAKHFLVTFGLKEQTFSIRAGCDMIGQIRRFKAKRSAHFAYGLL